MKEVECYLCGYPKINGSSVDNASVSCSESAESKCRGEFCITGGAAFQEAMDPSAVLWFHLSEAFDCGRQKPAILTQHGT